MTLPFELTTLPPQALDILRYMGNISLDSADAYALIEGTGFSERSFSKGIKRLVTKNYMMMDEARVYHLTQKGYKAIEDVAAHDAVSPPTPAGDESDLLQYDLCVIVPANVPGTGYTPFMLGLEPLPGYELESEIQLILRLEMLNGDTNPREFAANLSPEVPVVMAQFHVTPKEAEGALRLRVEAFQSIRMDELEEAGGMFLDVPLNQTYAGPRALHTTLDIIQED